MTANCNETFIEFSFEAAHQTPPYSGLHGHSFRVELFLRGDPHPVYGWSHNLYEVTEKVEVLKRQIDHSYLNDIRGLEVPTLENVAKWIWTTLEKEINGLDRVVLRRGNIGQTEGCTYSGPS